jgi:hypothetical protein
MAGNMAGGEGKDKGERRGAHHVVSISPFRRLELGHR